MNLTGIHFEEYKSKQSIKFPSNSSIQILDLTLILYHRILAMIVFRVIVLRLDGLRPIGRDQTTRQDPVSTMQKTGWTNYSSFLVWKRVSPMDVVARGQLTTNLLYVGSFWHGDT